MKSAVLVDPAILRLIHADLRTTSWDGPKMRPHFHRVALAQSQYDIVDPANLCRALDDRIEHGLHVRGRAADNAEYLRCCRLMLQRLAQLCIAFLQFFKQPHVLDGDDRLGCEGLKESDLLIGERTDLLTTDRNRSNPNTL